MTEPGISISVGQPMRTSEFRNRLDIDSDGEEVTDMVNNARRLKKQNTELEVLYEQLSINEGDRLELLSEINSRIINADYELFNTILKTFPFNLYFNLLITCDDDDLLTIIMQTLSNTSKTPKFPVALFSSVEIVGQLVENTRSDNILISRSAIMLLTNILSMRPSVRDYLLKYDICHLLTRLQMNYPLLELVSIICLIQPLPSHEDIQDLTTILFAVLNGNETENLSLALQSLLHLYDNGATDIPIDSLYELLTTMVASGAKNLILYSLQLLNRSQVLPAHTCDLLLSCLKKEMSNPVAICVSSIICKFYSDWQPYLDHNPAIALLNLYGVFSFAAQVEMTKAIITCADSDVLRQTKFLSIVMQQLSTAELTYSCLQVIYKILTSSIDETVFQEQISMIHESTGELERIASDSRTEIAQLVYLIFDKL